jgi:asparagine synthase (glutamine-hydrolysing)
MRADNGDEVSDVLRGFHLSDAEADFETLFDRDKRQLFLARDRFGVKPMFLAHLSDGSIAFASELKGLLAHPLLRRRINPQAIEAYMTWGYVPDSHAILAGVEKLPAGHFWLMEQGRAPGRPQRWWDIDFTSRERGSEADLSAQLVHLMRDAVRSRMVADVPLGAFLSGGVDSSGVVALMSEASASPVQTCSIGFDIAVHLRITFTSSSLSSSPRSCHCFFDYD